MDQKKNKLMYSALYVYLLTALFAIMYPRSENIKKTWISSECGITVCSQTNILVNDSEEFQCLGEIVAYPGVLFEGGSTNSVEDRRQRERGYGGGSHQFRGSSQFTND
jgi:hypothetical protein